MNQEAGLVKEHGPERHGQEPEARRAQDLPAAPLACPCKVMDIRKLGVAVIPIAVWKVRRRVADRDVVLGHADGIHELPQ